MKFGQFMTYYKKNNFIKNSQKSVAWKLVPGAFALAKNWAQPALENEIFQAIYLHQIHNSKATEMSPNQHAGLLRLFFTNDFLKIKMALELVSRSSFSYNFLIKSFIL